MGIAPYKYFTYDGESSRNYDVYLTGEGVFNAPERAVEMLEIPGRNGNYALDQGKFNNITVTYKAGIVDVSESNFADKVSAVRNWLCSKVGYKRLSDDYNPNEYRMAVYKSGVKLDHVDLKTGEFEITFDCKPQRWLTSGETAVTVADGGTLDNPTPFESEPLLAVKGYGDISINSKTISVADTTIGEVLVYASKGVNFPYQTLDITLDDQYANNGDTITLKQSLYNAQWEFTGGSVYGVSVASVSGDGTASISINGNQQAYVGMLLNDCVFYYGTSAYKEVTATFNVVTISPTYQGTLTWRATYNGTDTITLDAIESNMSVNLESGYDYVTIGDIILNSTKSASPIYIDLDIGEAYTISSGSVASLNNMVIIPTDLLTLASGTNTFTYDNTITELKVTPRWWKV